MAGVSYTVTYLGFDVADPTGAVVCSDAACAGPVISSFMAATLGWSIHNQTLRQLNIERGENWILTLFHTIIHLQVEVRYFHSLVYRQLELIRHKCTALPNRKSKSSYSAIQPFLHVPEALMVSTRTCSDQFPGTQSLYLGL